jgi:hypothetical protein
MRYEVDGKAEDKAERASKLRLTKICIGIGTHNYFKNEED